MTKSLKKRAIALVIPVMGLLTWSLFIMINSFNRGETWRIIFSVTGFILFFILACLFFYGLNKKIRAEKMD
ncbi:MAG TPA: hypothetical protein VJ896_12565 [Bacteroidales bacterium]|nr:hypothetical protein [Bacteroidales bacterium]